MSKPFISKNNPFDEPGINGEVFTYNYLTPRYWPTWLFLGLSFLFAYLPKYPRTIIGDLAGKILYSIGSSKKSIVDINLKLTLHNFKLFY